MNLNPMNADPDLVLTPENEDIVFWLKTRKNDELSAIAAIEIEGLRNRVKFLEAIANKYIGKGFVNKEGAD